MHGPNVGILASQAIHKASQANTRLEKRSRPKATPAAFLETAATTANEGSPRSIECAASPSTARPSKCHIADQRTP